MPDPALPSPVAITARNGVLLFCRPGFEPEAGTEFARMAEAQRITGTLANGAGWVEFSPAPPHLASLLAERSDFSRLAFARQLVVVERRCDHLPRGDRVAPLLTALEGLDSPCSELWVETPDHPDSAPLLPLCRSLEGRLREGGRTAGWLRESPWRAHVIFIDSATAYVGRSLIGNSSGWLRGIPRLRRLTAAPSRATAKLDEAFHQFLDPTSRARQLRPGLEAVDLGAAPGGWSWLLLQAGLRVIAVDNAELRPPARGSPLLTHLQRDAYSFIPSHPVEWLVCDLVDRPSRVAGLIASWIANGWCRAAIFNLKLPMKQRLKELDGCARTIDSALARRGVKEPARFKQLYHDREEVTGYCVCPPSRELP